MGLAWAVGQVGAGLDGFGERVQFKGVKNAFVTQKSVQLRPFSCRGEQWVWWQLSQLSCSRGAWRSLRPAGMLGYPAHRCWAPARPRSLSAALQTPRRFPAPASRLLVAVLLHE